MQSSLGRRWIPDSGELPKGIQSLAGWRDSPASIRGSHGRNRALSPPQLSLAVSAMDAGSSLRWRSSHRESARRNHTTLCRAAVLPVHLFGKPRIERRSATSSCRSATASAVQRPCLRALSFPIGTPGDFPPCIRQRPFATAGDWHGIPFRVRVPQRGLRCMGNPLCTGLFLQSALIPAPVARWRPP